MLRRSSHYKPSLEVLPIKPTVANALPNDARKEQAFDKALHDIGQLLNSQDVRSKTVFISYAWEDESTPEGKIAHTALQDWLLKLSKHLEAVDITVMLDIKSNNGDMTDWMSRSIEVSDHIIIIGTPRYKMRIINDTNSHVAFEFRKILAKINSSKDPKLLLPILYQGSHDASFPKEVKRNLIRDFTSAKNYYLQLIGLERPLGLIPGIFTELQPSGRCNGDYAWQLSSFIRKQDQLDAEIKNSLMLPLANVCDYLPDRCPYFVGRNDAFKQLRKHFDKIGRVVVVVKGLAGSGKSQLASEFANASKDTLHPYNLIRWMKSDTEDNLRDSYLKLAGDLGIKPELYRTSPAAFISELNIKLLSYKRVLLIYDNVTSFIHLDAYQLSAGGDASIHVIVTTREEFTDHPTIEAKEFTAKEILSFLNKRFQKKLSLALAEKLGKALGYLPFVIVQACALMVKRNISPEDFLSNMQAQRSSVSINILDQKIQTVDALRNLNLESLSAVAKEILQFCAFLDPDNIPQNLLERMLPKESISAVLYELRSQSLLLESSSGNHLRMHRLLQESIKRQLEEEDPSLARAIVEKGIKAIKFLATKNERISVAEGYVFWKKRDTLAMQIRHLINTGGSLKISSRSLAMLMSWAAEYAAQVKLDYEKSLDLYRGSLELYRLAYGENHPTVADCICSIADIYEAQNEHNKAIQFYEQALAIREEFYNTSHVEVIQTLRYIAGVCQARNDTKLANYYNQQALLRQGVSDTRITSVSQNNVLHSRQIEKTRIWKSAPTVSVEIEHGLQLLAICKAENGDNHPLVADSLTTLGNLYKTEGNYNQARSYFEQAFVARRKNYGLKHSSIAESLYDIGQCYSAQKNYVVGIAYCRKASIMYVEIDGKYNDRSAIIEGAIAVYYLNNSQCQQADETYQNIIKIRSVLWEKNKLDQANLMLNIGKQFVNFEQQERALKYYELALAIFQSVYDPDRKELVDALIEAAELYGEIGKYEKSVEFYTKAINSLKLKHGPGHEKVKVLSKKIHLVRVSMSHVYNRDTKVTADNEEFEKYREGKIANGKPGLRERRREMKAKVLGNSDKTLTFLPAFETKAAQKSNQDMLKIETSDRCIDTMSTEISRGSSDQSPAVAKRPGNLFAQRKAMFENKSAAAASKAKLNV